MRVRSGGITAMVVGVAVALALPTGGSALVVPNGRVATFHAELTAGRRTRVQHLEEVLDTIAHREGTLRAFITVTGVAARVSAKDADAVRAQMISSRLDGVVVAVKDNIEMAGVRTTAGSRQLAKVTASRNDATVVERLRLAGAIVVGTTNMDTWARGVRGLSEVRGQTSNPWDERRNAGGSSAGSAAAVAAGMADVALGTDTCGSLRYPASSVGIYSLRPTAGLVSRAGVVPLSPTHDVVGPMAAHPDDLEALLDVISAGRDARDPLTSTAPGVLPAIPVGRPLRVGVLEGLGRVDPGVLARLRAGGVEVVEAEPLPRAVTSGALVIEDESLPSRAVYLAWRRDAAGLSGRPDPWLTDALEVSDAKGYRSRRAAGVTARQTISALMDRLQVDALAMPTTVAGPTRLGQAQPSGNCHVSATTGLPALTIPAGDGRTGVPPIGVDLVGRQWSEHTLIALARRTV